MSINVEKRDGTVEVLDLEKIHKMVEEACQGLGGVSSSQVEMNSGIQFFDGITTIQIQEILIRSASDLIDLDHPNYQFVAARLLLSCLRKEAFHKNIWKEGMPSVFDVTAYNATINKVYDEEILDKYSDEDWAKINSWIDHGRDYLFTYAGLRQVTDKYLVQDRSAGEVYETPQYMYMLIALTLFAEYPLATRLDYVKRYYDAISKHKINIPTPIMAGVRTPLRQFASCVLVDSDDTLDSIFSSDMAIGRYVAQRAGIGINAGRIRGVNSKIRGGEVAHTGVIPFLKKFEATVRCCTQNGIRGGSATVHFPIWHQEIEDIIVLKNNNIFYLLVPDWEVDCRASTSDAILSATSDSCFKLFKEWDNTCVCNFSTSDLTVDSTDSACVDTDSCTLSNIAANRHVTRKDTIEGVIAINKNTASKLSKWSSHPRHDRCGNVDFVFGDRVVVSLDIIESGSQWVFSKES